MSASDGNNSKIEHPPGRIVSEAGATPVPSEAEPAEPQPASSGVEPDNVTAGVEQVFYDNVLNMDEQAAKHQSQKHQNQLEKLTGLKSTSKDSTGAMPAKQKRHRTPEERAVAKEAKEKAQKQKDLEHEIRVGVKKAYLLIIPVSICMAAVIVCLKILEEENEDGEGKEHFGYTPYEDSSGDTADQLGGAALNAMILLAIIVALTFGLVICYKNEWYKAIHGWLILSTVLLVYFFSYSFISDVLWVTNTAMSWPTLGFIVYNFGTVGMIAIHWKAPLLLQQFYLIAVSTLMAMVFIKYLPDWTTWIVLGLMAVYDLVAVLCPFGPLRMLVETAQKRDQPLFPALIYSSSMVWLINMADIDVPSNRPPSNNSSPKVNKKPVLNSTIDIPSEDPIKKKQNIPDSDEDFTGVKLGLGDFIFYSILVGKASQESDWGVVIACYVCIVVGLVMTIFILCIAQKALPALPFSIFMALSFYFATQPTIVPYIDMNAERMIMI